MPIRNPTDEEVVDTMLVLGGGFIHALAEAFQKADRENQRRIKMAFLEEWNEYRALAKLAQERPPDVRRG